MPSPPRLPSPAAWAADLHLAGVFLTRLPLGSLMRAGTPARAVRAYPVVGAAVGAAGGGTLLAAAALGLPAPAAAGLAVGVTILVTGALHEDGLADVADACGPADRDQRLAVMRDSRVGTFGVLALVLSVLLRVAALAGPAPLVAAAGLAGAAGAARAGPAVLLHAMPPARGDGLAAGVGRPDRETLGWAVGLGALALVLPAVAAGPTAAAAMALAVAAATAGAGFLAHRLVGGLTGDTLGAGIQAAEITALLALAGAA